MGRSGGGAPTSPLSIGMQNAVCVDELTLQGMVLPTTLVETLGEEDGNNAGQQTIQIPILAVGGAEKAQKDGPEERDPESQSEATVAMEDDEEDDAQTTTMNSSRMTFMGRLMREYSLRRDINALIARKQQQLQEMDVLLNQYREELQRMIRELDAEETQQQIEAKTMKEQLTQRVGEFLRTGRSREYVTLCRSIGLLEQQRNRVTQQRTRLRRRILATRHEECEWLWKSITAKHEQECQELTSAETAKKFLEEGSLKATVSVQIAQDDPFFASAEKLYASQPQCKQLQLQLESVEALLATSREKRDEMDAQNVSASGPVPLVKRSSFKRATEAFPSDTQKRELRRVLVACQFARNDRTCSAEERARQYTQRINEFTRCAADLRTRSGRLLYQFVDRLHGDTLEWVQLRYPMTSVTESASRRKPSESPDRFFFSSLDHRALARISESRAEDNQQNEDMTLLYDGPATDVLKLPPSSVITAFSRFLARVITSEYDLMESEDGIESPRSFDGSESELDGDVLNECVHELVFQKIPRVMNATAMDFAAEHRELDDESTHNWVLPWHWQHSKQTIQGVSPLELEFPADVMASITAFLDDHVDQVSAQGFLPETLAAFRAVDLETTPKGVVRGVMTAFRVLHRELINVLAFTPKSSKPKQRGKHRRRASCFLNADVLIPAIVLLMSRLPDPDRDLERLWQRVQLVQAFRSAILSEGCEEAYYLTCLTAAMEFIHTFQLRGVETPHEESAGDVRTQYTCESCEVMAATVRGLKITEIKQPAAASFATTSSANALEAAKRKSFRGGPSRSGHGWHKGEPEAIKQLSKWISDQPPQVDPTALVTQSDRFVAPFELWLHKPPPIE
ncbi:hypothetical protein Poli38472_001712 [Pythium oligandrum]|uniref:VPS9 domain-containing protein n=1 Tax=Pythium oligandrum TaxID=41045 RepID=A0A8K1FNM4_PYTOL|nr:hypothetical protein Poli38472_001712 [Pythium oligandrum]|eukprot:TMW69556.1 hypothetical protein Poli38472_001712 [Pythium oligandrum]